MSVENISVSIPHLFQLQNVINKSLERKTKTSYMNFKYFENADQLLSQVDNQVECACCHLTKKCFEATLHFVVCSDCLTTNQLYNLDTTNCNGDINELKKQIKYLNSNYTEKEIDKIAKEKTEELEKTTPHLVTWQDWDWPCSDGDYCKFIGYGSKALYNKLSKNDGKTLFTNSMYKHLKDSDTEYLWDEIMSEDEIINYEDSSQYGTLFYVFKSLNSENIVTVWDCD